MPSFQQLEIQTGQSVQQFGKLQASWVCLKWTFDPNLNPISSHTVDKIYLSVQADVISYLWILLDFWATSQLHVAVPRTLRSHRQSLLHREIYQNNPIMYRSIEQYNRIIQSIVAVTAALQDVSIQRSGTTCSDTLHCMYDVAVWQYWQTQVTSDKITTTHLLLHKALHSIAGTKPSGIDSHSRK